MILPKVSPTPMALILVKRSIVAVASLCTFLDSLIIIVKTMFGYSVCWL